MMASYAKDPHCTALADALEPLRRALTRLRLRLGAAVVVAEPDARLTFVRIRRWGRCPARG